MHLGVSQRAVISLAAEIEVELAYVSRSVFDGSDGIVNTSNTLGKKKPKYFQASPELLTMWHSLVTGSQLITFLTRAGRSRRRPQAPVTDFELYHSPTKPSSLIQAEYRRQTKDLFLPFQRNTPIKMRRLAYKLTWHAGRSRRELRDAVQSHRTQLRFPNSPRCLRTRGSLHLAAPCRKVDSILLSRLILGKGLQPGLNP